MALTRSGHFLGQYGTQAGGVIDVHWEPDPIVFSERILDVRDELADRTVPLAISKGVIAADIRENFEGEHDPEGMPWAPWSSSFKYEDPATPGKQVSYRGYGDNLPPGHSGKILDWRGILREAATSESAFVQVSGQTVNDDSLFFDTGGLPPYWEYHQEGLPERQTPLPQRRFLGMSDEAEIQVLEVFDGWFQGIVEKATSSRGRTFARYRDPATGRFARNPNA